MREPVNLVEDRWRKRRQARARRLRRHEQRVVKKKTFADYLAKVHTGWRLASSPLNPTRNDAAACCDNRSNTDTLKIQSTLGQDRITIGRAPSSGLPASSVDAQTKTVVWSR
jgi:hypothetical protein